MIDKNLVDLTNEDIISSLEVIATTRNCNDCKIRNCKWGTCNCEKITANAALDLISRQKAEIEKLNGELIHALSELSLILASLNIAKAKAYKEFEARLENEINIRTTLSREQDKNVIHMMHNLLKEMVNNNE